MSAFLETLASYQASQIADLLAIIGTRIYPVEAPQEVEAPYAVFTQISGGTDVNHGGRSGWGSMRVQYDFYAYKFHETHDAADALGDAFEGKSVQIAEGTEVCFCKVETEFDHEPDEERIYRRTIDLLFEYQIT